MAPKKKNKMPIDQGWAWVIVAAASALFGLTAGGFKIQGVILLEVIEKFEDIYPPSTLLWVFTVAFTLDSFCGPICSLVIMKFGFRTAAVTGVLLMAISQAGIGYAFNLTTLFIFFSIPNGFGVGLVILSALLVTGPYFRKRRALAVGLVAGGSGVGTFTLPYILRGLYSMFDFTGAMLLFSGFTLQFLCPAMLLRPIEFYEKLHLADKTSSSDDNEEEMKMLTDTDKKGDEDFLQPRARSATVSHHTLTVTPFQTIRCNSDTNIPQRILSEIEHTNSSTHRTTIHHRKLSSDKSKTPHSDLHIVSVGNFAGSVMFVDQDIVKEETTRNDSGQSKSAADSYQEEKQKFNWRVIIMPKFLMMCMSVLVFAMGNAVVYATLPALGKEKGVSKDVVALAMVFSGVVEIPCRICNGFLADRKYMSATAQYTLCLFMCGALTLGATYLPGTAGIVLALAGFAMMGTSVFNLQPIVVREIVGPELVTSSLGIQSLYHCVSTIIASYITGAIYDTSGSWSYVFVFISAASILGSMIMWPYLILQRCRNGKQGDLDVSD